jgi:Holliday junction resolvase-like predicted endonuclease
MTVLDEQRRNLPVLATMTRSSRHSKITGDFAERLVLYWLSKSGYECVWVDHTGIDIIAAAKDETLIGISVQCRSRISGRGRESVSLHDFEKTREACRPFRCDPYSAIVVDRDGTIACYLVPLDHLEQIAGAKIVRQWRMSDKFLKACQDDQKIARFELTGCSHWCDGREVLDRLFRR